LSRKPVRFTWSKRRSDVAIFLASGHTVKEASDEYQVSERSIWRWRADSEFAAEVDRLSLMVDIASRAERLRMAMRIVRKRISKAEDTGKDPSKADLLYWLQYVQSETNGAKIDVNGLLAALSAVAPSLAGEGSDRDDAVGEGDDDEAE